MTLYEIEVLNNKGKPITLEQYKGKVLLIINSATACGFTPQYKELEELYEKYRDQGFEILDFPCNQFFNQASGSDEEIHAFCTGRFGIQFPLFKKIEVNGENAHPLFVFLKNAKPYVEPNNEEGKKTMKMVESYSQTQNSPVDIRWNFTKFLVNRDGKVIERFEPVINIQEIEKVIKTIL